MDEWEEEGVELEEDSEFDDEKDRGGDEEEVLTEDEEGDDEFEQYLFGEDGD